MERNRIMRLLFMDEYIIRESFSFFNKINSSDTKLQSIPISSQ